MKVFDISEFPQQFHNKIAEKQHHCGGACKWYPGDGFFKPIAEVKNQSKMHFYGKENENTKDVYVYEEGDGDDIGDWLMKNYNIKCCEEILIK